MTWTESLTDAGFGLGWSVAKAMPEPLVEGMFRAAADRTWRKQGPGVRQLQANLARVLDDDRIGELDEVTHEGLRRYMRYWCEVFRLPSWSPQRVTESFRLNEGLDVLDEAVAAGKGAIMVSPHAGNWDLAAAWASLRYGGIVTVAERLKPESLYDKFVSYRESLGMEVHPLGDPSVLRQLARSLREGKLVCLLGDRDISHNGVSVDFFGEAASMPAGPAVLSLLTGAPIMSVSLWHVDDGMEGRVGKPLAVPTEGDRASQIAAITQSIADEFAGHIARHPEDWHVMQPLWTADVEQHT